MAANGRRGLSAFYQYDQQQQHSFHAHQLQKHEFAAQSRSTLRNLAGFLGRIWDERGRPMTIVMARGLLRRIRRNLTAQRVWSFPHLLVGVWVVLLLWGERWDFGSQVERCHWRHWEKWPAEARPHHVVLVADPQLIDPHTYPERPWPLSSLTELVTDNYLRRSFKALRKCLVPDTVFFLGDLFDGGREWKTKRGSFENPEWLVHPPSEQNYIKKWNRKYNHKFWLKEYKRFGNIFLEPRAWASKKAEVWKNRMRIIASLPGNHDLGFGSGVKTAVRDRFETYFGNGNRVDVVGNHTFVSVDTPSLSAGTSKLKDLPEVEKIYRPVYDFLDRTKHLKQKAVKSELRHIRGDHETERFVHQVENAEETKFEKTVVLMEQGPDLPTILLTHVPLYRPPGTPCGPMREHWPPKKTGSGENRPVVPDDSNAISVSAGFQYQNVLSLEDSVHLVAKIGNVIQVFSGDDHDYCELRHDADLGSVPEITVKSISMAMGVTKPGFLMVSLHNPIDADGKSISGDGRATLQTHLCILPSQVSTYARYVALVILTLVLLSVRASLIPVLGLTPFAFDGSGASAAAWDLPLYRQRDVKAKMDDSDAHYASSPSTNTAVDFSVSRYGGTAGGRDRSGTGIFPGGARSNGLARSMSSGGSAGRSLRPSPTGSLHGRKRNGKWSWGRHTGLRIEIRSDDDADHVEGARWRLASVRRRVSARAIWAAGREFWATALRVAWMVVGFWCFLAWKG